MFDSHWVLSPTLSNGIELIKVYQQIISQGEAKPTWFPSSTSAEIGSPGLIKTHLVNVEVIKYL